MSSQKRAFTVRRRHGNSRRNALRSIRKREVVGVLILGAAKVGKSALVNRWCKGTYTDVYTPTVEEFRVNTCKCMGKNIRLGLVDLTGSGQFPGMLDLYIEKTDCIMLVYEVGNRDSIKEIIRLHEYVLKTRNDSSVNFSVVGTKSDLSDDARKGLIDEEISDLLKKLGNPRHITTSAKLDFNVPDAFENSVNDAIGIMLPTDIALNQKKKKGFCSRFCCCCCRGS